MGRVLEEVILQELGLTGTGLILAKFEGCYVVERSHFHSLDSSHDFILQISRAPWLLGLCAGGMQGWFVSLCWFGLGLGTVLCTEKIDPPSPCLPRGDTCMHLCSYITYTSICICTVLY